ncbi:MAG: DUF2797 domain-containing protein [Bacteroidales bacterium]|nr:DUF2797 domain-containing protein [Bacteroidales bacterium]MBN2698365.1 DUF2797 domain-containing protein [Bacteroidales bacterium]
MHAGSSYVEQSLSEMKVRVREAIPEELKSYYIEEDRSLSINYPVKEFPEKVTSIDFDKTPMVAGTLNGIKGQSLLFDQDRVLNIRKFGGYLIRLNVSAG